MMDEISAENTALKALLPQLCAAVARALDWAYIWVMKRMWK